MHIAHEQDIISKWCIGLATKGICNLNAQHCVDHCTFALVQRCLKALIGDGLMQWCILNPVLRTLQEEDPEKYEKHFASYVEAELEGDDLEDLYKEVRSLTCNLLQSRCNIDDS